MEKTTSVLFAWCAGLFEGEGSIFTKVTTPSDRISRRYQIIVSMGNTDTALLKPFLETWGGRIRPKKGTPLSRKPYFEWRIECSRVVKFLRDVLPFLRGEKREKAIIAIDFKERMTLAGRKRTPRGTISVTNEEELKWRESARAKIRA